MRRLSLLALALVAQACTITIPAGVVGQIKDPGASAAPCAATLAQYDKDKDGSWSQQEFSAYFATLPQTAIACLDPADPSKTITCPQHDPVVQFKRYDGDNDGKITAAEFCAGPGATPTPGPTPLGTPVPAPTPTPIKGNPPPVYVSDACMADFKAFDTNGNGSLSYDEYAEGRYGKLRFFRAPTPEEVEASKKGFRDEAKKLDTTGDQQLSLAEFAGSCQ